MPQQDPSAIKSAFLAFLQKKYGFKSDSNHPVECVLEHAQTYKQQQMENQTKQANKQIVETGWKNAS